MFYTLDMIRMLSKCLIVAFVFNCIGSMPGHAQVIVPFMPKPGTMVSLSQAFTPAYLKGITINPSDPLKFDFIIHQGDKPLTEALKKEEYTKLIKYFLASLAVPDKHQWVNLSPYEKNYIINDDFGKTAMGRDLLAQDYLLKQITVSLMYPETGLGKEFWDKVYAKIYKEYPNNLSRLAVGVGTFNKVWIMPDSAEIYEKNGTAYVLKNHLKVMLEEDYLAMKAVGPAPAAPRPSSLALGVDKGSASKSPAAGASQIMRETILPAIEQEINTAKNFAPLRQIYSGMILAAWYKRSLKESLLGKIYADKVKIKGTEYKQSILKDLSTREHSLEKVAPSPSKLNDVEAIYNQYLQSFKKGVFNLVKEEHDPHTGQSIPRKYFSGGAVGYDYDRAVTVTKNDAAMRGTLSDAGKLDAVSTALEITAQGAGIYGLVTPDAAMQSFHSNQFKLVGGGEVDAFVATHLITWALEYYSEIIYGLLKKEFSIGLPAGVLSVNSQDRYLLDRTLEMFGNIYTELKQKGIDHVPYFKMFVRLSEAGVDDFIFVVNYREEFLIPPFDSDTFADFTKRMASMTQITPKRVKVVGFFGNKSISMEGERNNIIYSNQAMFANLATPIQKNAAMDRSSTRARRMIIDARLNKNLTQAKLAERILLAQGNARPTISQVESLRIMLSGMENGKEKRPLYTRKEMLRIISRLLNLDFKILWVKIVLEHAGHENRGDYRNSLPNILWIARILKGLSLPEVEQIAKEQGYSPLITSENLSSYENGRVPKIATLQDLIAILDINEDNLLGITREAVENAFEVADRKFPNAEKAMAGGISPGGIDLNSSNLNLKIKRDGKGVALPLAQQDIAQWGRIKGLEPRILAIFPVETLPVFYGLKLRLKAD